MADQGDPQGRSEGDERASPAVVGRWAAAAILERSYASQTGRRPVEVYPAAALWASQAADNFSNTAFTFG
jgi:hypothetical protein